MFKTEAGGARVAQWWEHKPPTNVAYMGSNLGVDTINVGWVRC